MLSKLHGLVLLFLIVYTLSSLLFISLVEERLELYGDIDFSDVTSGETLQSKRRQEEKSRGSLTANRSVKYKLFNEHFKGNGFADRKMPRKEILQNVKKKSGDVHASISRPVIAACVNGSEYTSNLQKGFFQLRKVIFLYSAFYDSRETIPFIRIIAALIKGFTVGHKLWCHFDKLFDADDSNGYVTPVSFYQMCENHHRKYGGYILSCKLPEKYIVQGRQPCIVRVSESPSVTDNSKSSVDMSILTTDRSRETQIDFAVCVPPLFGKIRNEDLLQFVELARILGANYFVFYVYDVNPRVKPVLSYYESIGIATVLRWSVPSVNKGDIWYYGQSLAINDCLYRHMSTVNYLIFNDLDEFLVPHVPHLRSWRDIASAIDNPNITCGMTFKSAFYDIALRTNGNNTISNLTVLDITSRSKHFSGPRNKVMVQPRKVFEVGIHHVSRPWPDIANYSVFEVSPELAFIHHYRPCVTTFDMNCMDGDTDTTVVDRHGNQFYENYLHSFRNIFSKSRSLKKSV